MNPASTAESAVALRPANRGDAARERLARGAGPRIFHDYFAIRGGGERLVLELASALEGSLVHGYRTSDTYDAAMFPELTASLDLPPPLRRSGLRPLALALAFARLRRAEAARGGVRIFSGIAAPFAAPRRSAAGFNIYYCHTPPRFLFDQREHFAARLRSGQRTLARPILAGFERAYRDVVGRMDLIVTNSQNTRNRIARYLGVESTVVHPPVDTGLFTWAGQGDYYLSTARLTPLKRVDAIVRAFIAMPDRKLVVASGGEQLEALKRLAAGAPNIAFTGWIDDETLRRLIGQAIATIYVPRAEDFGMSAVESMAAGKPVIGVAEGGLLETIIPGRTGILLPPEFTPDHIAAAVRALDPDRALRMREACELRAQSFSLQKFAASMRAMVERAERSIAGASEMLAS